MPEFVPGVLAKAATSPDLANYLPPAPSVLTRWLPGRKTAHEERVRRAHERHEADLQAHADAERTRTERLAKAKAAHDLQVQELRDKTVAQHAEVEAFKADLAARKPEAVESYFSLVLQASQYPDDFPKQVRLAYVSESKQLVVEYDLPPFEVVPAAGSYRYVKARDEIVETASPLNQRKAMYASVLGQVCLRTIHELFEADRAKIVDTIVFNGHVSTIHAATGRDHHPCLITLRTTRDVFGSLQLNRVDPIACLKNLSASVSKSPAELLPVRPVLEFDMVDPRFVPEADVLSGLDQRPNLMELTPSEFESLITNLFTKMGLETKQTQASRDGGVDCVAFDPRPIFGGKVIIQAKRYKNTVGVSAVRDLYGTLQNEGASKGILVTTSGYGKAAYDFVQSKPLELLSGSNLLYLLKEHTGVEAKIEVPDNWKDPGLDVDGV
jgi:restriction system protein